jgi:hypothetical protein
MRPQPDVPRSSEHLLASMRSSPAALEALYRRDLPVSEPVCSVARPPRLLEPSRRGRQDPVHSCGAE